MNDYHPYQRRFYMMVLRLLVIIARNTYKGQYSTFDDFNLREAEILHDEIRGGQYLRGESMKRTVKKP